MDQLRELIQKSKISITPVTGVNRGAILEAIAYAESNLGQKRFCARYEPAYGRGGSYFNEDLHRRYGDFAAMSYGTWQIMFSVAYELGYRNHPWLLVNDSYSIYWTIRYINVRAIGRGASTPEQIFDSYNSGSHRDSFIPHEYIRKAMSHYRICKISYLEGRS